MMTPPAVYVETTILSYLAAREPRDPVNAAHHRVTREWWERDRHRHRLVISAVVLREIAAGDLGVAAARAALTAGMELLAITPTVHELAQALISRKLVPAAVADDALHLAIATVGQADYLLTWNLRHLAGAVARRRIEQHLRELGHAPPTICTPEELKAAYD